MFNKIFIRKEYLVKHEILCTLQKYFVDGTKGLEFDQEVNDMDVSMTVDELAEKTGYKSQEISEQIDYLLYKHLIHDYDNPPEIYYSITPTGRIILNQKSYLKEGKKSSWALTKEIATFITSISLFLIAIWTFVSNVYTTNKNEKGIKELQIKVDSLIILQKQVVTKVILVDTSKVEVKKVLGPKGIK